MPLSMTAYARGEERLTLGGVFVEIQTLNRRFLEVRVNLPDECAHFEPLIRRLIREQISRGRVTVTLSVQWEQFPHTLKLNKGYLKELQRLWGELLEEDREQSSSLPIEWLKTDSNLLTSEVSTHAEKEIESAIETVLKRALEALHHNKALEGAELTKEIEQLLTQIGKELKEIKALALPLVDTFKAKFKEKLKELAYPPEEERERLMREVFLYADKVDINEELSRFSTHLTHFSTLLNSSKQALGKHLDFLLQEMLREINTLTSKAGNVEISTRVVEIKTRLEQIREQIQNVE